MEAVAQSIGICLAALALGVALASLIVVGICAYCDRQYLGIDDDVHPLP